MYIHIYIYMFIYVTEFSRITASPCTKKPQTHTVQPLRAALVNNCSHIGDNRNVPVACARDRLCPDASTEAQETSHAC